MKLIDLQLLVTHVVAFLIVLWLLRRFAWGPVLRLLDARRAAIAGEFDAAAARRREAESLHQEYEGHLARIEIESRERLREAVTEAKGAAARIRERAEEERRLRLERAEEEVRLLEESARETLRRRTADLAVRAAEKAILARLDEAQHRKLMEQFIADLEAADRRGQAG